VTFIDTPGFDNTVKDGAEILALISLSLRRAHSENKLLSGVIYLHRITDMKITGASVRRLALKKMCDTERYENIALATTMWDTVTEDIREQREKELKEKYWEHILSGGGNTYRHDSKETSAEKIVMKFLPYQSVVLGIQEEILGHLLALSDRIWLDIRKRWQELFGHHPGLFDRIRQTRSLSPKSLLALAIWFASPVLADEPASRSSVHNRQNILRFIKHTDLARKHFQFILG
jgi:hypothetical protein